MANSSEQERVVNEILKESFEAVTIGDFGLRILPMLERVLETQPSLIYRRDEFGRILPLGGGLATIITSYIPYYDGDPMHEGFNRSSPWVQSGSSMPEWKPFLRCQAYTDWFSLHNIHDFLHVRLTSTRHCDPGLVGLLLVRSPRQALFGRREGKIASRILPALEALVRRSARTEAVEATMEGARKPIVALSPQGALLWHSKRADEILGITRGVRKLLPEDLVKGAKSFGVLFGKSPSSGHPSSAVALSDKNGNTIRVELRLVRTASGAPVVIAELEDLDSTPYLKEVAARYGLTSAETQVLGRLALGLSDREIGRRLFVSLSTVHTHVVRVLDKLGVHSRVQAALLAHGFKADTESEKKSKEA